MLIRDPSSNEAEQTINILRNSGHAVRATQITNADELETALEQQRWDLFIVRDNLESPNAEECLKIVQHYGRNIAFIMTTDDYSVERTLEALRLGMRDVIPDDNDEYFRLVVERELDAIDAKKLGHKASNTLKENEKRNELLLDSSRDAIAYITDGMHIYANHAYMQLFGYEDEDELACIPIIDLVESEHQEDFRNYLKAHSKGEETDEFSFHGVKESGDTFEATISLTESQYDGENCTQVYLKMVEADDAALEQKIKELSLKDRLTGLYNQDYLNDALDKAKEAAAVDNKLYSLVYVAPDHFEKFLEEFGIGAIDVYIKQIADWLQKITDSSAEITRVGDSNFAILMPISKPEQGAELAEKICSQFAEEMFDINQKTFMDTVSIGIVTVSENAPDSQKILSNAHFASTRALSKGGNQIKMHDANLDKLDNREDTQTAIEIQEALDSDKLTLLFEPIVKLMGNVEHMYHCNIGVESDNEVRKLTDVFDISLRTDTAANLDLWLCEQALDALSQQLSDDPELTLKINLTPASILNPELTSKIEDIFDKTSVPKERVIFEFNEEFVVAHLKHTIELLAALNDIGVNIAVGDFGSTLNSEELMINLGTDNIQWLSIDHALMTDFSSNSASQEKLAVLLQFAKENELQTIVPDLADAGSLAVIWPMNADHISGSYIAFPNTEMDFNFEESSFF